MENPRRWVTCVCTWAVLICQITMVTPTCSVSSSQSFFHGNNIVSSDVISNPGNGTITVIDVSTILPAGIIDSITFFAEDFVERSSYPSLMLQVWRPLQGTPGSFSLVWKESLTLYSGNVIENIHHKSICVEAGDRLGWTTAADSYLVASRESPQGETYIRQDEPTHSPAQEKTYTFSLRSTPVLPSLAVNMRSDTEPMCPSGKFGESCEKTCRCHYDNACSRLTGGCARGCMAGWGGSDCQTECEVGTYGPNCASKCGYCVQADKCSKTNGVCINGGCQPGYKGETCHTVCNPGSYGYNCQNMCGLCSRGEACRNTDGECLEGCAQGWTGHKCDKACKETDCADICNHCAQADLCRKLNGSCTESGCMPGWHGDRCDAECEVGTYGPNCPSTCGHCLEIDQCRKTDGVCMNGGCQPGWLGVKCDTAEVPTTSGSETSMPTTSTPVATAGSTTVTQPGIVPLRGPLEGSEPGNSSPSPAVIGGAVAGVVGVIIVVIAVAAAWYWRRKEPIADPEQPIADPEAGKTRMYVRQLPTAEGDEYVNGPAAEDPPYELPGPTTPDPGNDYLTINTLNRDRGRSGQQNEDVAYENNQSPAHENEDAGYVNPSSLPGRSGPLVPPHPPSHPEPPADVQGLDSEYLTHKNVYQRPPSMQDEEIYHEIDENYAYGDVINPPGQEGEQ